MTDLEYAISIITKEADAVYQLLDHVDDHFLRAVELCRNCNGNIIVSGVGKSGFIAQKMAATLASLGVSSWWLHPNDAEHGDIGRVTDRDICILFSYSGSTKEIVSLSERIKSRNAKIIAITGNPLSTLSKNADITLNLGQFEEAGMIKLIPTSSTTVSLALSDALALTIVGSSLKPDEFGKNHPGGTIGLRLSPVRKIMRTDKECVIVPLGTSLWETILKISSARSGAAIVVDEAGNMVGIFTDGDLRRWVATIADDYKAFMSFNIEHCANENPISVSADSLVEDALNLFKQKKIGDLPVIENGKPVGMISLKDLTRLAL